MCVCEFGSFDSINKIFFSCPKTKFIAIFVRQIKINLMNNIILLNNQPPYKIYTSAFKRILLHFIFFWKQHSIKYYVKLPVSFPIGWISRHFLCVFFFIQVDPNDLTFDLLSKCEQMWMSSQKCDDAESRYFVQFSKR